MTIIAGNYDNVWCFNIYN